MRKILHEEFWRVVREHVSDNEYYEMVGAFRGAKVENNITDVEDRFKKQGVLMARAAALNGCDCPGDNEEYYARMLEITRRVLGDEILTNPDMDLKNILIQTNISVRLYRRRSLHLVTNLMAENSRIRPMMVTSAIMITKYNPAIFYYAVAWQALYSAKIKGI